MKAVKKNLKNILRLQAFKKIRKIFLIKKGRKKNKKKTLEHLKALKKSRKIFLSRSAIEKNLVK